MKALKTVAVALGITLGALIIIPLIVRRWGKGAYCGWICSCGALAETLGDTHRQKMPHGPRANRWNMAGQVILGIALLLLVLRILGDPTPRSAVSRSVVLPSARTAGPADFARQAEGSGGTATALGRSYGPRTEG